MTDYLARNQAAWDAQAADYVEAGERGWAGEPTWGIFQVPEQEVGLLADVDGRDAVELGCGTGYVSAWLARRGARPVGVDLSPEQLRTARRLQEEHDLRFPLVRAAAEHVPFRDGSFDLAISEYGAAIWSDPYQWIPEASRLLRSGGRLAFLGNSTLLMLCAHDDETVPADARLLRPAFGLHRMEWPGEESVEFHLNHGDMIRLLRASGLVVEDLIELQAPEGATTRYTFVDAAWARQWPCEEIWVARKG